MSKILTCLLVSFFSVQIHAQIIPFTVDPVKISDFSPVSHLISPETDAVVLLESGETILDATPQTGFFTKYHYFKRLLILNKNGLGQSTDSVYYNSEADGKKLKSLHIATYNLENGKIIKTGIQEKDLFIEDPKKEVRKVKFAFPNAQVGSILEIEYTVSSGSIDLNSWFFQRTNPILRSTYSVRIPNNWNFVITIQNKNYLTAVKKDSLVKNIYSWKYTYEDITVYTVNWIFENIPPMKEEPYTSTIGNYIGCIKFQLAVRPLQPGQSERLLNDWQWVSNRLLLDDDFGLAIKEPNPWIFKLAKTIVNGDDPDLEKAKKIFAFVREHLKTESRGWGISEGSSLETVYKSGKGNVAETNLLLIALLRTQKLNAEGVILATRDNGLTNISYPVMENFNYAICRLEIAGKVYFLDASDPTMGFGKLPAECYNGQARIIDKNPSAVYFSPDSIRESSSIYVDIENDESKKFLKVDWTEHPGYYESSDIRQFIRDHNNSQDAYSKSYTKKKSFPETIDSFTISDVKDLERPVTLNFKMRINPSGEEHYYFNPVMNAGLVNNPFKSAERNYPVELPYLFDDSYVLNMDIPEGYEVEELPRSVRIKLNENDGIFEYLIQKNEKSIQFKNILNIKKATFDPADYNSLRDFYAFIVKKQAEEIVFKKIKK
jgi:hypothetical protein